MTFGGHRGGHDERTGVIAVTSAEPTVELPAVAPRRGLAGRLRAAAGGPADPRRTLAVVLTGVLVAGGVGWAVGSSVRSPADAAASRQPPPASLMTVAVERRTLTATVLTSGTVEFGSPQPLLLAGAVGSTEPDGGAGAGASGSFGQRVTRAPRAGQLLKEGTTVMEVNGRPVFVLTGAVPMFRTIGPGRHGRDVRQLQRALGRLGFRPGRTDGTFGADTAAAVRRWYEARGYPAQEPSAAEKQQLRGLEQAVQTAVEERLAAEAEVAAVRAGPGRRMLDVKLRHARQNLADARVDLAEYRRTFGTAVPAGELVFLPSVPVRMTEVAVRVGQNVEAEVGTVTSSTVVVQANVTTQDADLLREGMRAAVETVDAKTVPGRVTALRDKARVRQEGPSSGDDGRGGSDSTGQQPNQDDDSVPAGAVPLRVAPDNPKALGGQAGGTVKLTIAVGSTSNPVLVVPVAAVTTGADGQSRLQVARGAGATVDVPVKLGLAALGYVQVTPAAGAALTEGDRVVVGST
jgi:peptidoglycan hydrolase-like protein with peptidoglycan-binding domain